MIRKELWQKQLLCIYKNESIASNISDELETRFRRFNTSGMPGKELDEKDVMLITYGDTLTRDGENGFATLHGFLKRFVGNAITNVHILPMFPYTSDDGFSVVDYKEINPSLGCWEDVHLLAQDYGLMFDAVINHVSQSSDWFRRYLRCEKPYCDYFITCDPDADYSAVTRPRALPLLTKFDTAEGEKYVWTTFSSDQIDLNLRCPALLCDLLDVLLTYAQNGARFIRLDAIGFLWKELGTSCMHRPETHAFIKLARCVLEDYFPGVMLITETNVPYKDNISYFGSGDEAHLVYNFPLPPLVMFSLLTGSAARLTAWAAALDTPLPGTTYFNFLSSHDGIGLRPAEGILTDEERHLLVESTLRNGGAVSYKNNSDGTKSPYELNINYQDALASPEENDSTRIGRFLAAETILLSLQGMPGIYIHSLLGSRNDYYDSAVSGIPRRINRERLDADALESSLTRLSNRKTIFDELLRRLRIRKEHPAFSPASMQEILKLSDHVFAFRRFCPSENITVVIHVSGESTLIHSPYLVGKELLSGTVSQETASLAPYECRWIQS